MAKTGVKCASCGYTCEEASAFCGHCGLPLPKTDPNSGGDSQTYLYLVKANVHRLRRQWYQAEAECGEILRREPENSDAWSLLGDIARDRGRPRDAVEWYRLAVTRNPLNMQDRAKLDRLLDQVSRRPPRGVVRKISSGISKGVAAARADVGPLWRTSGLTAAVGVALVIILVIAALFSGRPEPNPRAPRASGVAGGFDSATDNGGTAAGSGARRRQEGAGEGGGESEGSLPAAMGKFGGDLLPLETGLLAHLRLLAQEVDVNCRVESVEIDPASGSVHIRLSAPRLWTPAAMRQSAVRLLGKLGPAAAAWDERIRRVRVRCDLRESGQAGAVAVLADGSAGELAQGTATTEGELGALYDSLWWSPELGTGTGEDTSGREG
jgi:hypothetical protein